MALDFSLADFINSRTRSTPATPQLADIIGFESGDNSNARNALLDAILSSLQPTAQPRRQDFIDQLGAAFESSVRQPQPQVDVADFIFRGNPSVPQVSTTPVPTNSILESVVEQPVVSEPRINSITGDIRRSVNVPEIMAQNTAMFQRTQPKVLPQAPMIQQPQLPEIFASVPGIERASASITGFDPRNPPRAHTLTEQQYNSLPEPLQQQYRQQTERRFAMIQDAQERQRQLSDVGINDAVAARSEKRRADLRKDETDSAIAALDLESAAKKQLEADTKLKEAAAKFADWRTKLDQQVSRGFLRIDPKSKSITAVDKSIPAANKSAADRIAERAEIEKDVAEATREQKAAAAEFGKAQDRARRSRISAQPQPSATIQPAGSFGQFTEGQTIRRKDGTMWVVRNGQPVPVR